MQTGLALAVLMTDAAANNFGNTYMTIAIEIIGWAAALLILASYLLVSSGRLSGQSPTFQWMNVVGAAGFILNSGWHGALPSAVLNIAWAGIGIFTLVRLARIRSG